MLEASMGVLVGLCLITGIIKAWIACCWLPYVKRWWTDQTDDDPNTNFGAIFPFSEEEPETEFVSPRERWLRTERVVVVGAAGGKRT